MRRLLAAGLVLAIVSVAGAARVEASPSGPTGPVYPPPGGVNVTSSGGIGLPGGLTWSYSGFDQVGWTQMVWGSSTPPALAFDGNIDQPGETLAVSSADTDLATGLVVWTGHATINVSGNDLDLPTRLTMKVTSGAQPVPLMDPSAVGFDPQRGGLVPVVDASTTYSVNLLFEADYNGWTPALALFNSLSTNGSIVREEFSGGFWYVDPAVQLSTSALGFGSQTVGSTSAAQQVTVTNSGNDDLKNVALSISGANSGDFAIASTTCASTLGAGQTCSASVSFSPQGIGGRSANLDVASNAGSSPDQVALSGAGTAAPTVSVAPGSIAFGSQPVGTVSAYRSVVVTNTGTVPVHVSGLSMSGSGSTSFKLGKQTCTAVPVAPGDTRSALVRFAPRNVGPKTATLAVADDATGSPQAVALSGTGDPSADLATDIRDFPAAVASGGTLTWSISIADNGPSAAKTVVLADVVPSDVRVVSVTPLAGMSCKAPRVGATGTVTCTVKSLPSGGSREVDITVTVRTPPGGQLLDTVTVSSATADPVAANNSATATTPVS